MAMYESNYLRLLHLIPELERLDGCFRSRVAGDCELFVEILERCRYTVTLSLNGKSLGIMGTGSIGQHIARMAEPFGMYITGYSRSGSPVEGFQQVFAQHQLMEFLQAPDYIVGVLPDTPGSQDLLDAAAFRAMKDGCYLVNVGRGNLIDETALADALQAGKLAGAVLDVFRTEPLPDDSVLWNAPGLIVTGHVAAISWPRDIARIFSGNYQRFVAGEPLKYRIDFDQGY